MANSFGDLIKSFNTGVSPNYQYAVRERKDIYFDRWEYIIRDALDHVFSFDSAKAVKCLVTGEMNLTKRTVNAVSSIYQEPASRRLVVSEEEDTGELETDDVYNDIISTVPYDLIMRKANQMTNLTNACAVRTVWREGKLDYDVMTFDNLQVITDPSDWKKVIGWCFYIGYNQQYLQEDPGLQDDKVIADPGRAFLQEQAPYTNYESAILYTSDDDYFPEEFRSKIIYFDQKKGGDATIQVNGEGQQKIQENPYKDSEGNTILPFTLILKDYPIDYLIDYSSGNDLTYLTINTAIRYIHMNNMFANNSWKQPYVISNVELPTDWNVNPNSTLRIPLDKDGGTSEIGILDMQADIKSQWDVIVDMIKIGLAQSGIDAESFSRTGGNPESGFALEIRKEGLVELRKAQTPIYEVAEHDLFEKTRIVYNYHAEQENKPKISDKGKFTVDFGEVVSAVNQTEKDAHWLTIIRENVKNIYDWIKDENPDIKTDDEAEKIFRNNRAINTKNQSMLAPVQQPTTETDTEVDDEPEEV